MLSVFFQRPRVGFKIGSWSLRGRLPKRLTNYMYSWTSATGKRAVTLARYFLRPLNSRRGWTGLRYTWAKLTVMVKFCQAWNYTAVAVFRRAYFSCIKFRLLCTPSDYNYNQHNQIVWTHVQGQNVKSSQGKLLSKSKRVRGQEVAEKHSGFEAYQPLVHHQPSRS